MPVIEGARYRTGASAGVSGDTNGYGPFVNAGVPVDGTTFDEIAEKGALLVDITNGKLYINGGTKSASVWKLVTSAA